MPTIGSRIRRKRIERGMSVDELAAKLGKNRATIYRYESDDIENFPISIIAPLANALEISPAYLMGWIQDAIGKYEEMPTPDAEDGQKDKNIIKIAGRDGSFQERQLTDEQLAAIKAILSQMPDASDYV